MIKRMTSPSELADRYIRAFDDGDLETLAWIWNEACRDDELARVLLEIVDEAATESTPAHDWPRDAAELRRLLSRHFSPPVEQELRPLNAADVAARLQGEGLSNLGSDDQEANRVIMAKEVPVPAPLGWTELQRWATELDLPGSPRYWRAFRKQAVLMQIRRQHQTDRFAAGRNEDDRGS